MVVRRARTSYAGSRRRVHRPKAESFPALHENTTGIPTSRILPESVATNSGGRAEEATPIMVIRGARGSVSVEAPELGTFHSFWSHCRRPGASCATKKPPGGRRHGNPCFRLRRPPCGFRRWSEMPTGRLPSRRRRHVSYANGEQAENDV